MEIEEAANAIYLHLMEHRNDLCDTDLNKILQWNVIRYNICAKLINAEMNKELLEMIPHRLFMDLAVVYYISMNDIIGESGGIASILIHHNHMELWEQKEEDLYQAAIVNMRSEGKPLFEDISEVLEHMAPEFMDFMNNKLKAFGMYVLTNRQETFGASELLDKSTLKGIGEQLEDDFIVLPSSIHETIIIPSDNAPEFSELAVMVKRINKEQVDAQECLSDHVYMYDREKDKLEIVA